MAKPNRNNAALRPLIGGGLRHTIWQRLSHAWAALCGRPLSQTAANKATERANGGAAMDTVIVDNPTNAVVTASATEAPQPKDQQHPLRPYNPQALPTARAQWQGGDWTGLANLSLDNIQDHPDRAKLALLCAAGHLQVGRTREGTDGLRQAKAWGCTQQLINQVVIAGVHNSLGRAALLAGMAQRADQHFETSLRTVLPHSDTTAMLADRRRSQSPPPTLGTCHSGAKPN